MHKQVVRVHSPVASRDRDFPIVSRKECGFPLMSNDVNAIKGFEYQATVILDRLFDHFDRHGPSARVRPEGIVDLDLCWTEGGIDCRHYLQIKKPREDNDGQAEALDAV
jgi:hypothetical protein